MEENFWAWCIYFGAPHYCVLPDKYKPFREDRMLIHATPLWLKWLNVKTVDPNGCLYPWNIAISDHYPLSVIGIDEDTAIGGWRGRRVFAAIQIIYHTYGDLDFLEIDFDYISPSSGLFGIVGHVVEWVGYRLPLIIGRRRIRTDPYLVAKWLRRAGIVPNPTI